MPRNKRWSISYTSPNGLKLDNAIMSNIFTATEAKHMTEAGAQEAKKILEKNAPHMTEPHSMKLYGVERDKHLDEAVTITSSRSSGTNGVGAYSLVGWNSAYYPLAAWTNNGTYRQPAQFWWERKAIPEFKSKQPEIAKIVEAEADAIFLKKFGQGTWR